MSDGDESGLLPRIQDWLEQTGFSLEMRAARTLRRAGWIEVVPGDYYDDMMGPAAPVPREIDLWARESGASADHRFTASVRLVVEAKGVEAPWIVFVGEQPHRRFAQDSRLWHASRAGQIALDALSGDSGCELERLLADPIGYHLLSMPWRTRKRRDASAVTEPATDQGSGDKGPKEERDKINHAFEGLTTLDRAGRHFAYGATDCSGPPAPILCEVEVPVLLVRTSIVTCQLDDRGDTRLAEVPRATLLWRRGEVGQGHRRVVLVRESDFPQFAADALQAARSWITKALSRGPAVLAHLAEEARLRTNHDIVEGELPFV